jgi:ribosome biogenesis protein UTP30
MLVAESKKKIKRKNKLNKSKKEIKNEIEEEEISKSLSPTILEKIANTAKLKKIERRTRRLLKLDEVLIKKAVSGLIKHTKNVKKASKSFLESDDDFLMITITMSEIQEKFSVRPIRITLPHTLYSESEHTYACLFVKDPAKEFKELIEDMNLPCVAKIIGYKKLLTDYKQYKDRRDLLKKYDLFFTDIRIYKMLPKLLGNVFYKTKKYPVPIKFPVNATGSQIEEVLNANIQNSTYFMMGNGPNYSYKACRTSMSVEECVRNITESVYKVIPYILKTSIKHTKIQSISIHTQHSIPLPIYTYLPQSQIKAFIQTIQS